MASWQASCVTQLNASYTQLCYQWSGLFGSEFWMFQCNNGDVWGNSSVQCSALLDDARVWLNIWLAFGYKQQLRKWINSSLSWYSWMKYLGTKLSAKRMEITICSSAFYGFCFYRRQILNYSGFLGESFVNNIKLSIITKLQKTSNLFFTPCWWNINLYTLNWILVRR